MIVTKLVCIRNQTLQYSVAYLACRMWYQQCSCLVVHFSTLHEGKQSDNGSFTFQTLSGRLVIINNDLNGADKQKHSIMQRSIWPNLVVPTHTVAQINLLQQTNRHIKIQQHLFTDLFQVLVDI